MRPFVVGITGQIASGKSTIAKRLTEAGFQIINTDEVAKQIIQKNTLIQHQISDLIGVGAFIDGVYQRQYVARRIFSDKSLRLGLNAIVHPAVTTYIQHLFENAYVSERVVFIESALLFDSDVYRLCDRVIEVKAAFLVRLRRVMRRDKIGFWLGVKKLLSQKTIDPHRVHLVLSTDGEESIEDLMQTLLQSIERWTKF